MIFLPKSDQQYLCERGLFVEGVTDGASKGIILKNFTLPSGRFDLATADILIVLPAGYPDVPPDMFYLLPWLRLAQGSQYPKAADQPFLFQEQSWQRWSRHNSDWRPGIDGIWTMLKRVEHALEVAA